MNALNTPGAPGVAAPTVPCPALFFQIVNNSSLNELVGNISDSNRSNGYWDLTTGKGTAGTANNYLANECSNNEQAGSNPAGLCDPQP
jgi:hypothetical protein